MCAGFPDTTEAWTKLGRQKGNVARFGSGFHSLEDTKLLPTDGNIESMLNKCNDFLKGHKGAPAWQAHRENLPLTLLFSQRSRSQGRMGVQEGKATSCLLSKPMKPGTPGGRKRASNEP